MKNLSSLTTLCLCAVPNINALAPIVSQTITRVPINSNALSLSSVNLPLKSLLSPNTEESLMKAFNVMVDSTEFFTSAPMATKQYPIIPIGAAAIPLFGNDVTLTLDVNVEKNICTLSLNGKNVSADDFGWIAAKFYELKELFEESDVDTFSLRKIVANHFNAQPPHPGYDAQQTSNNNLVSELCGGKESQILSDLHRIGYAIIDDKFPATPESCLKLSKKLTEKTCQGNHVRTDSVSFITRDDAFECELGTQFDLLMAMASFLNENFPFSPSQYEPLTPATRNRPLTNPLTVQAAEYRMGDFYVAHSDNSINGSVRSNFRHFTCIHYLNEMWDQHKDGGCLRLYLNSSNLNSSAEAKASCQYVDISPQNGRFLIFDSKLFHSVEVVKTDRSRLALTLWITRPEDSGVNGERWDEGLPSVE